MKSIPLTRGMIALVDDEDFEFLNQWRWYANATGTTRGYFYAVRQETLTGGSQTTVWMHRVIMHASEGELVDHRSRNTLDNQKGNLRKCSKAQNGANAKVRCDNTSGFKGVTFHRRIGKWQAQISGSKRRSLGYFTDRADAARRYDEEALALYGEFALTNESLGLFQK